MKLETNRRNLLHKDAIEREWPSGPHDTNKKGRSKSDRKSAKQDLKDTLLHIVCSSCGGNVCDPETCSHNEHGEDTWYDGVVSGNC